MRTPLHLALHGDQLPRVLVTSLLLGAIDSTNLWHRLLHSTGDLVPVIAHREVAFWASRAASYKKMSSKH